MMSIEAGEVHLNNGIVYEKIYKPTVDKSAESELVKWSSTNIMPGGSPFWIASPDYVGSCSNRTAAKIAVLSSQTRGFFTSVSDVSASQRTVCYWPSKG